jgi:hypothetical protein
MGLVPYSTACNALEDEVVSQKKVINGAVWPRIIFEKFPPQYKDSS